MRKWIFLVTGLGVAFWFHADFDEQTTLLDFALVFGLAGLFFLYGAPAPVVRPAPRVRSNGSLPARAWLAAVGTLFALAAAAGAAWLLWQDISDPLGLSLWGAAAICLLVGWWNPDVSRLAADPTPENQGRQWDWWVLAGIVLIALVVRLWNLEAYPYGLQSDESNNAKDALQWLAGAPYTPYSEANRGQATLFTYLIALSFKLFGIDVPAMRYVSVLVGTVTVFSFYILARTLFSRSVALLTTALLAVSRWHITFSRIIYELIMMPLALIWLFYFLYRGMRERVPRYFVLAGFALALGFNTYTAFRVVPLGVALLALFWLIANWREFWGNLTRLLLFAFSTLVGLLPLLIYMLQKTEVILLRIRELSIFDEIEAVGSWQPFWYNVRSYAAMFNLVGDKATLNNLPGAPMVSLVGGALFVLGLLYAIRYWRHPAMFMLLVWIMAVIPAGILSVTRETPSARRVIGLAPLLFLFVGVAADALQRATVATWRGQARLLWPVCATAMVVLFAYTELKTFFYDQVTNIDVHRAFNIGEWSVGSYMATIDSTTMKILLDRRYADNNVVDFAARNKPYILLDESRIPFQPASSSVSESGAAADAGSDLLYLVRPTGSQLRPLLEHFYPQGHWQEHRDPQGMLLFNTFELPLSVQRQARGLVARYYSLESPSAPTMLLAERIEAEVGGAAPVSAPYRVHWSGSLQVQLHGHYQFTVETRYPFTLTVGDHVVASQAGAAQGTDQAGDQIRVTAPTTTTLYAGIHPIQVTVVMTETTVGPANRTVTAPTVRLLWRGPFPQQPVPPTALLALDAPTFGLIGAYYPNNNWEGAPTAIRHDLVVGPTTILPSPYSVIWRGKFWAPGDGSYVLGINADDGALLYLDEQLIVDNGGLHGANYVENRVQLSAGLHDVVLQYVQDGGAEALDLSWDWPGGGQQPLPVQQLLPYAVDVTGLVAAAAPATASELPATTTNVAAEQVTIFHNANGAFTQPHGVAVGSDGRIYITDTGNRRLVGLAPDGTVLFEQTAGAEPLQEPFDLGIDAVGQIYVLDPAAGRIELFAADGAYLRLLNADPELVGRARGLFVTPQGEVWVAHTAGGRIVKLGANGEVLQVIPIPRAQPVDVAVDSIGVIYVTEIEQHRLLRLDPMGQIVAEYTIPSANGVDSPHLAVDAQDFLYITEPEAGAVLKLSPAGEVIFRQKLPESLGLLVKPIGIAVDGQGKIWIADAQGGSVWRLNLEN